MNGEKENRRRIVLGFAVRGVSAEDLQKFENEKENEERERLVGAENMSVARSVGARVDRAAAFGQRGGVSLAEIKAAIEGLTDEERIFLASYLRRRIDENSPARRAELAAIRDEMEQGRRFTFDQLKKRHEELLSEGL